MSNKNEYPKMLYRSDDQHNAQRSNKEGVFYTVAKDAEAESAAVAKGFRATVHGAGVAVIASKPKAPKGPKAQK